MSCHGLLPVAARPEERAITAPLSLYCEQLRGIRTGLGLGEPGRQILAVTAARPAEGKTTLCVSLARMLAASGLRVLAIDGDVRCPGFGRVFGLEERPGLAELLRGTAQLPDALGRDKLTSLSLLCAGGERASALDLFLSPALPALLAALREHYDIILLDVPPAFALAEARVLCRMADLTLLCIRWAAPAPAGARGAEFAARGRRRCGRHRAHPRQPRRPCPLFPCRRRILRPALWRVCDEIAGRRTAPFSCGARGCGACAAAGAANHGPG
ncbi:CpsD/CapB family tyrosine-protein kinase [Acidocella sp. MX-AZ03]|uniref:CpsD/CapB family tyrosine-protein kinase n=1 Tax=Acidocella sp. MX-AZ03 TaxID=2697363 RepID=UPI0022DCF17B|nr:CpsD/CapB family tyrosine-protein kinase [Acidocella sp. MX-AZ03]WBO60195.1 CpsD/CapB family tyrosine-protein kinase [Acidocella sp. MX-AZ03]